MAKAAKLKILYGEGNVEAQAVTAAAFEKAGHTVEKALGRKAVEAALNKGGFDLVVLGPTLSRNDRHHLPYAVKKVQAEAKTPPKRSVAVQPSVPSSEASSEAAKAQPSEQQQEVA